MNHHLLQWLIAIVLMTMTGCLPRHPPHTPQPYSMKVPTCGVVLIDGH